MMTEEEALENYNIAQKQYRDAKSEYAYWCRMEEEYSAARRAALNRAEECKTEKVNFQKWLKEIESILKIMEGSGGWWSQSLPDDVEKAAKNSRETAESFSKCIQCSDIGSSDLNLVFQTKSVEADPDSGRALNLLRAEKARIEKMIGNLAAAIKDQEDLVDTLRSKIRTCTRNQADYRSQMNSLSSDMEDYRRMML